MIKNGVQTDEEAFRCLLARLSNNGHPRTIVPLGPRTVGDYTYWRYDVDYVRYHVDIDGHVSKTKLIRKTA